MMYPTSRLRVLPKLTTLAVLTAVLVSFTHHARALTPADQQEIQNFTLTDDFLKRFEGVAAADHGRLEEKDPAKLRVMMASLDSISAAVASAPAAKAVLDQYGLTPRQAAVGSIVLMRAQMADTMLADPKQAKYLDKSRIPNARHMAFYRAHKADITKVLEKDRKD
jgi:cell division protein FtsL